MSVAPDGPGLAPCDRIGFDVTQPVWSESVALFVTSADGQSAVSLRLCRYPSAGTAWVWAHVFTPEGSWAFNVDHHPCGPEVTDVDADDVTYAVDGITFDRHGSRATPSGGSVAMRVMAHQGAEAPDAEGTEPVNITGAFTPSAAAGATLPGRSELLGEATVLIDAEGHAPITVSGHAQFHEQHQDAPRFVVPFTYASLRGPDLSMIALIGPRASGGFSRGGDGEHRYTAARIPAPIDSAHAIELDAETGATVTGRAEVVRSFTIPVYGRPWWGTIVAATIDGHRLTGSVNRWRYASEQP